MPSYRTHVFRPGSFAARRQHYCRRCGSWWREGLFRAHTRSPKHRAALKRAHAR